MDTICFETLLLCEALNEAAFEAIKAQCHAGKTEVQVQNVIQTAWAQKAVCDAPFSGDIVGGIRSGAIEGEATDYVLQSGDALIVDIQSGVGGHFADTTRTFFVGQPTDKQRHAYAAVQKTLERLAAMLKPGVRACDIHAAMQQSLAEFELSCPHHAGHALGREKLLPPTFVPECTDILTEGMVVALEPGVYYEGEFGVRLENNYRITEKGAECLSPYTLEMEDYIL